MSDQALMNLAIERQCFHEKAGSDAYESLFRYIQPVRPVYWSCPGDPPRIVHRADFDDAQRNFDLRADRILVLHDGRLVASGTPAAVFGDVAAMRAAGVRVPDVTAVAVALNGRAGEPLPVTFEGGLRWLAGIG